MAPRRRAAAQAAAPSPPPPPAQPLDGCVIAISGKTEMPDAIKASLDKKILELGGVIVMSVTKNCTHVIAHRSHYEKTKSLCRAAKSKGVPMVSVDWIEEAETNAASVKVDDFFWENIMQAEDDALLAQQMGQAPATKKRPIAVANPNGSANGNDDTEKKPKAKKAKTTSKKAKAEEEEDEKKPDVDEAGEAEQVADGQFLKKKDAVIPLDAYCTLYGYQVYIDDAGLIFDASLNQTNASHNNNKFYIVQLLMHPGLKQYKTWTRWGRVGEPGANAVLGDGDLASAMKQFEKKFKDKSGLSWQNRNEPAKPGKYSFVEKSYDQDSDDDDDEANDDSKGVKKEEEDEYKPPVCTLAPPVQGLMEMIFNQQFFQATMANLNYDAKKLPLGKLSKSTILKAFEKLKDLAALLNDPSLAASRWNETTPVAIEHLSNSYYSLIPHDFGRHRPLIINDDNLLKKELELLESLSDMKVATDLMKVEKKVHDPIHPLDQRFQGLGLDEMTALDHKSAEFELLENYLNNTRGSTHNRSYKVIEIFRIERGGERSRFGNSQYSKIPSDRRLLWHGSRCTNFGGILSQGLRIAPPEAPVSGYMFGKGIYLADMSSKSANYCASYLSNNEGLLLLCEAELGNPMQELYNSDYDAGDNAKKKGMHTTKGLGRAAPQVWMDAGAVNSDLKGVQMPDPAHKPSADDYKPGDKYCLQYNEYICYDVDQVQLKYLFRVKM